MQEPIPGCRWIDSHCHLADNAFSDDAQEAADRAERVGIEKMIVIGDNLERSRAAIEWSRRDRRIFAVAGVHPHNATDWSPELARELREIASQGEAVTIGEIGVDYHYDFAPRDLQLRSFFEQAEIARETGLPIVIHCREAYDELIGWVDGHRLGEIGGVVHCFGGDADQALRLAEKGFFISLSGAVTFKKADELRNVARLLPLESLLLETDAPYLAPVPHRGRRNEPALLPHTALEVARVRDIAIETLAEAVWNNTIRVFRLDKKGCELTA
jgi:TatD DNase family protein